ncbi:uncharacterized protein LOC127744786 [Arachis duranensis]|uniref:Uncharacterized protein LOC127744786 n=1 Tax=Arachis duranensis TaxID=130453 RepID=A0A9C6WKH5_ARADU|nr:uncharacterized protein LOC127744786 [Arachis duranensis]
MSSVGDGDDVGLGFRKPQKITDREDEYRQRRVKQIISLERYDSFFVGEKTPKEETLKAIAKKKKKEEEDTAKAASLQVAPTLQQQQ